MYPPARNAKAPLDYIPKYSRSALGRPGSLRICVFKRFMLFFACLSHLCHFKGFIAETLMLVVEASVSFTISFASSFSSDTLFNS